ncbi:MAG: hypothetical protein NXH75_11460 [Halobacteriovoraceae bacterium]|nr:hypothetical protein [Halobacteriovoraceae bacterium]
MTKTRTFFLLLFCLSPLFAFAKESKSIDFSKICYKEICFRKSIDILELKKHGFKRIDSSSKVFRLFKEEKGKTKLIVRVYLNSLEKNSTYIQSLYVMIADKNKKELPFRKIIKGIPDFINRNNINSAKAFKYRFSNKKNTHGLTIWDPKFPPVVPPFIDWFDG